MNRAMILCQNNWVLWYGSPSKVLICILSFQASMADSAATSDPTTEDPSLSTQERYYAYFVGLSTGIWGALFFLILIPRIIVYLCNRPQRRAPAGSKSARTDQILIEPSFYSSIQNWAEDLISGNTTTGRILVVFAFICSMVSFILYIISKSLIFFMYAHNFPFLAILVTFEPLLSLFLPNVLPVFVPFLIRFWSSIQNWTEDLIIWNTSTG